MDPRELVRLAIQNGEQAWRQSAGYFHFKQVTGQEFDASGKARTSSEDRYEMIPLGYGASFEKHVLHDGQPVAAADRQSDDEEMQKLRAQSAAQLKHRSQRENAERSYMREVADAFDYRIIGEENLPTGKAWVVEGTPRPGYEPKSRYAKVFPRMRGTLWVDEKDLQWVKADAVATADVSFGWFIARLSKGSHIVLEQMRLPDGAWVPKSITAKADARTFLFFNHNFQQVITYSGYRKPNRLEASASAPK